MNKLGIKNESGKILEEKFIENKMNKDFDILLRKLKISDEDAKKNMSHLNDTLCELANCKNCPGLNKCPNHISGYVYYPEMRESRLTFNYVACKKLKDFNEKTNLKDNNYLLSNARIKDIDLSDKNRSELIKWISKFYKNFDISKENKGLYLHGSFGSGKTFIISALLNELALNYHITYEIIYFPELLRTLKDDFSMLDSKIRYYSNIDILFIDDIGAEKVTDWGRDEILGTILQSRMNKHLTTFFTSNLTIDELEKHLSISKDSLDVVKSRRIVERIKQLTKDMELISINRRN